MDPDLNFKNLNGSKKGLVKEEPPFATSVEMNENNETIVSKLSHQNHSLV